MFYVFGFFWCEGGIEWDFFVVYVVIGVWFIGVYGGVFLLVDEVDEGCCWYWSGE